MMPSHPLNPRSMTMEHVGCLSIVLSARLWLANQLPPLTRILFGPRFCAIGPNSKSEWTGTLDPLPAESWLSNSDGEIVKTGDLSR
jgi:hypothetical protein